MATSELAAPHLKPVGFVAAQVNTDAARGLTEIEARRRLLDDGPNTLASTTKTSWVDRFARQFVDPLVLLLLGALLISLVAWYLEKESAWPIDSIVIAIILGTNAALGAFQEHRADEAVQALATMAAGRATVIRDGHAIRVPTTEIVVGDLLSVSEGDVVAADARVTTVQSLLVSEAALTGESVPVAKRPEPVTEALGIGDRSCMIHTGTAVAVGHAQAIVTATAMDSEVGKIADMLASTTQVPTPLEREIAQVSRFLGFAVLAIAVVISVVIGINSNVDSVSDVMDILIIAVSVGVAAVPEGLPAVLSVVLAIGVARMARRNALVKRLASAETLGAATIICTDKTGTLTRNQMQVQTAVVPAGRCDLADATQDSAIGGALGSALVAAVAASNVDLAPDMGDAEGGSPLLGDPTETSLVRAAIAVAALDDYAAIERIDELPFDADRKRMSVLVRGLDVTAPASLVMITKGAPDVVLNLCTSERQRSGVVPLTDSRRAFWRRETESLADDAMRTLLVATRDVPAGFQLDRSQEAGLTVLGLFGLKDPPRTEVAAAIATAQRAGVRVVMLTGDHPNTAASIARTLGISSNDVHPLTAADIDEVDQAGLARLLETHAVFARVAPAHKLRMVQSLQQAGHVVAMTGDGVNDAPALKAADIGTAMGRSGTDVAREAADMVLTDDNFATIVEAVRGGRTIFTNIKSFLRYLLSSNVGEVLAIFLGVVFAGTIGLQGEGSSVIAPLTAAQILWINLLTDTGPAFALGVDPPAAGIMDEPPRGHHVRVIDATMQRGIAVVGLTMALATLVMFDAKRPGGLIEGTSDIATARTAAFTVLVLAQLFNCFSARSDRESALRGWSTNRLLLVAVAVSLLLQVAVVYVPLLQDGFGTTALELRDWLIATAVASSVLVVSELRKLIERRVLRHDAGAQGT